MTEVETLELVFEAVDSFSETLDDLVEGLLRVAEAQTLVDENQTLDVDVDGLGELAAYSALLESIDDRGGLSGALGGLDAGGPTATADGGATATADGGRRDSFFQLDRIGSGLPAEGLTDNVAGDLRTAQAQAFRVPIDDDDGGLSIRRLADEISLTASNLNNLRAAFIPLFANFIAALPAAIAGLAGLAGAAVGAVAGLGGILALGAMGFSAQRGGPGTIADGMERIRTEIAESFRETFRGVGQMFAPQIEAALGGLDRLFGNFRENIGVLNAFRDDLGRVGSFLVEWVPEITAGFIRLADVASPVVDEITGFLSGTSISRGLAGVLADVLPDLQAITIAIVRAIPSIIRLSEGFLLFVGALVTVTTWVVSFINVVTQIIERLTGLHVSVGAVIAVLFAFITAITLAAKVQAVFAATSLGLSTILGAGVVQALGAYIGALLTYIPTVSAATASTWGLYLAAASVVGLLTFGLAPVLSGIAGMFGGVTGEIKSATRELDRFAGTTGAIGGSFSSNGAIGARGVQYVNYSETNVAVESTGNETQDYRNANDAAFSQSSGTSGNATVTRLTSN